MDGRLKCKPKPLKLIGKSLGENICDLRFDRGFLDMTSKVQSTKEQIGKLSFIKGKTALQQTPLRKGKDWRKVLQSM
jgi:hypothetical protein